MFKERIETKRKIADLAQKLENKDRSTHKFYARALKKLGFNGKRLNVQQHPSTTYVEECIARTFHFTQIGIRITSVLGIGGEGVVFGGIWQNKRYAQGLPVAIKIVRFDEDNTAAQWQRQVNSQMRVNSRPGFRSPTILKCGVHTYLNWQFGIVIMEKIDITMDRVIRYSYQDSVVMRTVCRMLISLLETMRADGFVHGDLHVSNIGFIKHECTMSLVLIDLERSVWLPKLDCDDLLVNADTFFLWRSSLFPGPAWIAFNYTLQRLHLPVTHGLTADDVDHNGIAHRFGDYPTYEKELFKMLERWDDAISSPILDAINDRQHYKHHIPIATA